MKTKHAPYSLYKKRIGTRDFWYVRFWDERKRAYTAHRATGIEVYGKKGRRDEAAIAANAMMPSLCFCATKAALVPYLKAFWTEESPYFKEIEITRGSKVSAYYLKASQDLIRLHIEKFAPFQSIGIGSLTSSLLRDFMLWEAERGVSGDRINRALQVLRIPLRYAVQREELQADPFIRIKPAHSKLRIKGVLSQKETALLISLQVKDVNKRLGVLLGLICGMRLGEVRGLCWEDIDFHLGVIHVRHNWQNSDGMKPPKYNSCRDAPITPIIDEALKAAGEKTDGLVFCREKDSAPLSNGFFRKALVFMLESIGISREEQLTRNISFHSLRHTFVSLSYLAGLNDAHVMALTGHKSVAMFARYNHPEKVVDVAYCGRILAENAKQMSACL